MTELKYFGNRAKPLPLASIVKFIIIVAVILWMGERDREQTEENRSLSEKVLVQEQIISDMVCGPTIEMVMPIGKES